MTVLITYEKRMAIKNALDLEARRRVAALEEWEAEADKVDRAVARRERDLAYRRQRAKRLREEAAAAKMKKP